MSRYGTGWLAGSATRSFSIDVGTSLAGYVARTGPATGVHDELMVGALVLGHGDRRLTLVSADLAAVDSGLVDEIAAAASLDRAELCVCASHTHSGPAGVVPRLHPAADDRSDPALRAALVATCAVVIADARRRLAPVELLFGAADTEGLAANRNRVDGPYDGRISVLVARAASGELSAVLAHFACHPTILGAESRLVSAEFPGALRRALCDLLSVEGPVTDILYVNGAAGDVSTRHTRRGQDAAEIERVGSRLAAAAIQALDDARPVDGVLLQERRRVTLAPRSLGVAVTRPAAVEGPVMAAPSEAQRRMEETRAQGAALLDRLRETGVAPVRTTFDVEAWAVGDIALVAVPGELFASLGSSIVAASTSPTLVLGYANGYVGYLPDQPAYAAGTYEALASPFDAGAGERVAEIASDLVRCILARRGDEPSDA